MAAILKAKSAVRTGTGVDTYLSALLDGSLAVADFYTIAAMKGAVFTAASASVTTPTTWTATATIDITKPLFWMQVPTGKAALITSIQVYMEAFGTSAQFELNGVIGTGGSYTSGMTAITPVSSRADLGIGSSITTYAGGNTTVVVGSTTNLNPFWRDGAQFTITKSAGSATAAAGDQYKFCWFSSQHGMPEIVGPNYQFAINQGSQAGTGFVVVKYIEVNASALPS